MRLRSIVLAGLALFACALVPATAAEAATKKKCSVPRGAEVVAKNSQVIVYVVEREQDEVKDTLLACYRKNARRLKLADHTDDDFVTSVEYSQVTVNGRFVAWQWTATDQSCKADCPPGYEPTVYSIERADLKTRKTLRWTDSHAEDGTLVVSRAGNTAWVQSSGTAGEFAVRVGDKTGSNAIDTGAIDASTFNLRGTTLRWTNGGQPKTAQLP